MRLPKAGSVFELVEEKAAGGNHQVTVFRLVDVP